MTSAVETIIQAISPEFKPSDATAEEKGAASKITAVSRVFDFIFKDCPSYQVSFISDSLFKFLATQ
jgi:hypothetical protein